MLLRNHLALIVASLPPPVLQLGVNYLLSWFDVGVDVFEHRFEHGVVAHTQVLDLDLTVMRPVLGHLRGVCEEKHTRRLSFTFTTVERTVCSFKSMGS